MTRSGLTERRVIEELSHIFKSPAPPEGIGDDCAVIRIGRQQMLVSTDMLADSTHFSHIMSNMEKGRMAAAVNLSDIAAMGGRPVAMVVSLGIPRYMSMRDISDIARGINERAVEFGVRIVGGDTKSTQELTISITVMGRKTGRLLLRSGARAGQILAVTGTIGEAAAEYSRLERGEKPEKGSRLFNPEPRIEEGILLSKSGISSAAIDITDGLALSAWYISRASCVRLEIDEEAVPVARRLSGHGIGSTRQKEIAYYWGGDYELLFTAESREALGRVASRMKTPVTVIGSVCKGEGVYSRRGKKKALLEERGYDAFTGKKIDS